MVTNEHFDAVVVGSGFGGSVTAYRLRDAGRSVCVLERGRSWAPGDFPRSPREIQGNFWDPSERLFGLFDIWTFSDIEVLVSSCLGGGSIIYANVLLRKDEDWFTEADGRPWPVTRADLDPHYDAVQAIMKPQTYPFDVEPYSQTPKTRAMQDAAQANSHDWQLPPLAITFANPGQPPALGVPIQEGENLHHRPRYTCRLCGECNIGCNLGSKNTLDFNYLTKFEQAGGEIRTLAEVKTFAPRPGGGFTIDYLQHALDGQATPVTVTADRLVLSAGSLGTSFLLLKNRASFPGISEALGTRWCGNGDLLGFLRKAGRHLDPARGPVITSATRYPGESQRGYYIEDGGYPNFLNWVVETLDAPGELRRATTFVWRRLKNWVLDRPVSNISGEVSAFVGDTVRSSNTLPLLGMGRDVPDGRLSIAGGYLQNDWSTKTSQAYYASVRGSMKQLAGALKAEYHDEPLWYFRRNVTVHPVGGCPMGQHPNEGVTDAYGQVFNWPGLSIADGSVLPGPVGPNPSFTIAALADRFSDWMINNF